MTRYVWDADRKDWVLPGQRRVPAGSYVISDHLDDLVNHADGKRYSSKRAYYRAVRAAGCEIVGNEELRSAPRPEPVGVERDIVNAIRQHGG